MIKEEIEEACKERLAREEDDAFDIVDFALEMVQRHNEDLQKKARSKDWLAGDIVAKMIEEEKP